MVNSIFRPSRLYGLAIVFAFFIALYFALAGVDYGAQWDQSNIKGYVNKYVRTGNILPGEYHYPPGSSYIASTTIIPYVVPFIQRYGLNWVPTQRYLLDDVLKNPNQSFLLNLRRVFVFATLLGVLWTGFAAAQKNWLAGAVAAAALAFSWEVNYQSRIVHPDGPTMQFVALALLFGFLGLYNKRPFSYRVWFCLAAIASAAAAATKYTAGISILVILVLVYTRLIEEKDFSFKKTILYLGLLTLVFGAAFLIFVPGALLETPVFIQEIVRDQQIYAGGYGFQTVNAGWDYLIRELLYIFQAAFSHDRVLAIFFPSLAIVGAASLIKSGERRDLGLSAALAGIPVLYILFLATNRALFVRNLLIIFPSLAVLSGFGFSWLHEELKRFTLVWRAALVAVLLLVIAGNIGWLAITAESIKDRQTDAFARLALQAIGRLDDKMVYITPTALKLLGGLGLPPNAILQFDQNADLVLFAYRGDTLDEHEGGWPVNSPDASPQIFGPQEINMDWYASWPGVERLVLASTEIAWQDGANVKKNVAEPMAGMESEQVSGVLSLDGEQFFVEVEDKSYPILNSANPKLIRALLPRLDKEVSIAGIPYSEARAADWFVTDINGERILEETELKLEFNFPRFYENLSQAQRECVENSVGSATDQALVDTLFNLNELSEQELQGVAGCIN